LEFDIDIVLGLLDRLGEMADFMERVVLLSRNLLPHLLRTDRSCSGTGSSHSSTR
jgi:hypothetical protein